MFKFYFNKSLSSLKLVYFLALATTCVMNLKNASATICSLSECKNPVKTEVLAMFSRSIAIACLLCRITIMYKSKSDFPDYVKKVEDYELYFPVNISQKRHIRFIAMAIISSYIVIILPINVLRIYLIYTNYGKIHTMFFYTMMYVHNWSICTTEIHFIVRCVGLYQKFQSINEEMAALRLKTIAGNRFPVVLRQGERRGHDNALFIGLDTLGSGSPLSVSSNGYQPADRVELLRMKHQFVRGTVVELNDLYGIQLGLSICLLFIMTLFDIYGEVSVESNVTKTHVLLYGWLLQYSFRFCVIVLTSHVTTTQAHRPKMIITDINNRYADNSTKKELELFLCQLSSRPVEFTICDLFTLNIRLITSALVAGTTYLILLLQFH
ncbi:uncharacterized protein LOC132952314 [Metopolophium dirhodum]|uniref:uncharacterized protein LOC132952314 n=1 Tax=Metopolophium dirhodum TaxID=44670 RepID=UPI00298F4F2A|nr:uncharacterized protein LOC132952314 [Metopolophium dirhodum]